MHCIWSAGPAECSTALLACCAYAAVGTLHFQTAHTEFVVIHIMGCKLGTVG